MLELRELVKHYPAVGGEAVRAVDGVSLRVGEGDMVALYGPSGSGKTTLLLMVATLLERLGLGARLEHRAEMLSMGERQRVMIARALSTGPRLLLADEPTGSLDTQRGREVLELLRELSRERGVAIVLVSHDPMAARYADRAYALRDGRLSDYEPDGRHTPRSAQ